MRFKPGGWSCPTVCVDNNTAYPDFNTAWDRCGKVNGCTKIVKWTDGQFYLRSDADNIPDSTSDVLYANYGCRRMITKDITIYEFFCIIVKFNVLSFVT